MPTLKVFKFHPESAVKLLYFDSLHSLAVPLLNGAVDRYQLFPGQKDECANLGVVQYINN